MYPLLKINSKPTMDGLELEIERAVHSDDGMAAKAHLAAGRAIYNGDPQYPGQIVKQYPDGRRQFVSIDEKSAVTVIRDIKEKSRFGLGLSSV